VKDAQDACEDRDLRSLTVKVDRAELARLRGLTDDAVPLSVSVRRAIREYIASRTGRK
jgi:hypothetical protein